jgi:hypothetical protein
MNDEGLADAKPQTGRAKRPATWQSLFPDRMPLAHRMLLRDASREANMNSFRTFAVALAVVAMTVVPAFAKGGGGGGGGGGGAGSGGAGNGGGNSGGATGGVGNSGGGHGSGGQAPSGQGPGGHGHGLATGHDDGGSNGRVTGAGRGTAVTAPGSQHRSPRATQNLSAPTPGKASPGSGVTPGLGRVGTVPTTPGHQTP